ncbi:hypothetical protein lerEdw1_005391 [Lerista edwardsae]|nr:hypothetical protein lerEdw1_005391 [Lerista edwardsae]
MMLSFLLSPPRVHLDNWQPRPRMGLQHWLPNHGVHVIPMHMDPGMYMDEGMLMDPGMYINLGMHMDPGMLMGHDHNDFYKMLNHLLMISPNPLPGSGAIRDLFDNWQPQPHMDLQQWSSQPGVPIIPMHIDPGMHMDQGMLMDPRMLMDPGMLMGHDHNGFYKILNYLLMMSPNPPPRSGTIG